MDKKRDLLKQRQEVLERIQTIEDKIHNTDFDTESSVEDADNNLFHQLEQDRDVQETHLEEIETALKELGWEPDPSVED